ncbi:hypothetical protein T440DRAFT_51295 [Plenodomus tracheiphilus IPT5]|uniref:Uncharacterized protein n=1 Tax=Plenodomus tracheiphilus IPT5 TaxID=1408161 RepID=A0A6A7B9J6_9PLEO|nr:hypothetical protein T440DRAFT_51295 [Plenodomus tracheiphilus IPT5]
MQSATKKSMTLNIAHDASALPTAPRNASNTTGAPTSYFVPQISTFATSKRPTAEHYRAVLFGPDKARPEFTWLLCKRVQDDDDNVGGGYQMPETDKIIGNDILIKHMSYQYNPRLKKPLQDTIMLAYREAVLIDGSRPNRSIASITATQPGGYHDWRGPSLHIRKKEKNSIHRLAKTLTW